MLVVILDIIATIALCLYLANGQMALFEKGGFRNLMNRLKSTVTEEEPEEEAKLEAVSFRQAFQNFIGCKRLWFFGIAVALVSFGFYAWREFEIINAPLLNLKYMLLLYLFFAAAAFFRPGSTKGADDFAAPSIFPRSPRGDLTKNARSRVRRFLRNIEAMRPAKEREF